MLLVALVLVVMGGGVLLLMGGEDPESGDPRSNGAGSGDADGRRDEEASGANGPEQAVTEFLDAANAGDCERYVALVTEASVEAIGGTSSRDDARAACEDRIESVGVLLGTFGVPPVGVTVGSNDGATATVEVSLIVPESQETTVDITVRDEHGWKVDLASVPSQL